MVFKSNKVISIIDEFKIKDVLCSVFFYNHNHLVVFDSKKSTFYLLFGGPYTLNKKKALKLTINKSNKERLDAFNIIEEKEFSEFIKRIKKIRGD